MENVLCIEMRSRALNIAQTCSGIVMGALLAGVYEESFSEMGGWAQLLRFICL